MTLTTDHRHYDRPHTLDVHSTLIHVSIFMAKGYFLSPTVFADHLSSRLPFLSSSAWHNLCTSLSLYQFVLRIKYSWFSQNTTGFVRKLTYTGHDVVDDGRSFLHKDASNQRIFSGRTAKKAKTIHISPLPPNERTLRLEWFDDRTDGCQVLNRD